MTEITQHHPSSFRELKYVYPVVSRRAGGVSIGINLNLNASCTFDCVYCQIPAEKRHTAAQEQPIDLSVLETELRFVVEETLSGRLFSDNWFGRTEPEKRVLRDIAFAGDGEPTLSPEFFGAVQIAAKIRPCDVKLVLITNGSTLDSESVQRAIELLLANNGEIWVKLDASNEEEYGRINRSPVPFAKIVENIKNAAKKYPIVIQTCFFDGGISQIEIKGYISIIRSIGGNIDRIQAYTIARNPNESWVQPLSNACMDEIGQEISSATNLPVDVFYAK